ncbi:hypothetical protein [Dactylosporangium sp. NPDC006015]|uniref:hypothetical protein n=1 Tax=Dactylosporangium sp. NPDC006015 TaxID=3154576 RepID=UPI0033A43F45
MGMRDLSTEFGRAGLEFITVADPGHPYIPPAVAAAATNASEFPGRRWFEIPDDAPDLVERGNAAWHEMCCGHGLFTSEDRRFLVAVDLSEDSAYGTRWWAEVALTDDWDVVGEGSAGILGLGRGRPVFVMLSRDGDVAVRGDLWQRSIGGVLVPDVQRMQRSRQATGWILDDPRSSPADLRAVRRWLDHLAGLPDR